MLERAEEPESVLPSEEKFLDMLENSMDDPKLERVLKKAREINDVMSVLPATHSELKSIISELDGDWAPWMHTYMRASGTISAKINGEDVRVPLDGQDVYSRGFDIAYDVVDSVNIPKVVHIVKLPKIVFTKDTSDKDVIDAIAGIDEIVLETDNASTERAIAWIEISQPELVKEIDDLLMQSRNVEQSIESLAKLKLDSYSILHENFTRNCLDTYLNSLVLVDKAAPYDLNIDGLIATTDDSGDMVSEKRTTRTLAYLGDLQTMIFRAKDGTDEWRIGVSAAIIPSDQNTESESVIVPLESMSYIRSLRSSYYEARK